jgi:hypothetical protein
MLYNYICGTCLFQCIPSSEHQMQYLVLLVRSHQTMTFQCCSKNTILQNLSQFVTILMEMCKRARVSCVLGVRWSVFLWNFSFLGIQPDYFDLYRLYFSVGSYKLKDIFSNLFLEPTSTEQ